MAKVGAQRAAELTGRSKSTIQRAMNNGKLSFELDSNGRRLIDVSELDRAFGLMQQQSSAPQSTGPSIEAELEKASTMIEMERMKMRVRMLEEQLETALSQIADLKDQRDQWQKQASQMLITSQYSQKQAEELREEIKMREQRARERRDQMQKPGQSKRMRPENQNAQETAPENTAKPDTTDKTDAAAAAEAFNFKGLWKRVRGVAA